MGEREKDVPAEEAIVHNSQERRFEATIDGKLAEAAYTLEGDSITLTHTQVPPSVRGEGVGNNLARTAFEYARNNKLKVVVACRFMQSWLECNPEYADLVKRPAAQP